MILGSVAGGARRRHHRYPEYLQRSSRGSEVVTSLHQDSKPETLNPPKPWVGAVHGQEPAMGADVPVPEESSKLSKISALAPWALETSVRKRCGRASQVACLRVGSHDEGLVSLSWCVCASVF